jgi:hypothetical protein
MPSEIASVSNISFISSKVLLCYNIAFGCAKRVGKYVSLFTSLLPSRAKVSVIGLILIMAEI